MVTLTQLTTYSQGFPRIKYSGVSGYFLSQDNSNQLALKMAKLDSCCDKSSIYYDMWYLGDSIIKEQQKDIHRLGRQNFDCIEDNRQKISEIEKKDKQITILTDETEKRKIFIKRLFVTVGIETLVIVALIL